jgi:hypothetical protein
MKLRELAQDIHCHGASWTVSGDGLPLAWTRRAKCLFYLDCERTLIEAYPV